MEKYSVLMSLYYKEDPEYFRRAVDSMLSQTVKPDEILIVKDGAVTAELEGVLEELCAKAPDIITVIGYEENRGLGFALGFGTERVRNELVARMDTDDISLPERCELQLEFFEKYPETDIVGGMMEEFVGDEKNIIGKRTVPLTDDEIREYMKERCPFNHITVMYKRSAVMAAGGYRDWFFNEDYYLWLRMYLSSCRFANIPKTLALARVGEDMYRRRGGIKYFKSEARLQKFMLENKIIGYPVYISNVVKRLVVQVLLPNRLRGWVFKKFARESGGREE